MTTPILFLTWNRLAYSKICFERLRQIQDSVHIIVADNGSTDGTREWIDTLTVPSHITIERWLFPKNFGLFRVLNLYYAEMLKRNLSPYAAWCYNDMAPESHWIGVLTGILNGVPEAGMAFPAYSPYRPQNSTVSMGGYEVFVNNVAYFSDGFGVMRLDVFRKKIERGEYSFIPYNHPGMSLGNFFATVQTNWLLLASAQVDQTPACTIENHNGEEAYRRQEVLVKRKYAIDAKAYYEATVGKLTWLQDGVEKSWDDEPVESVGAPLTENLVLKAALDEGVSEGDIALL